MIFAFIATLLLAGPQAFASGEGWETDLEGALAKAAETDTVVLADFSGSDWCGWCIKLDKEVFSKERFKTFSAKNLINCIIDFPKDTSKISPEQQEMNKEYATRYEVSGYPTVLLLEPDGSVILQTGYREGGAESYVSFITTALKARKKVKEVLAEGTPTLEQAKAMLNKIPKELPVLRALVVIAAFPNDNVAKRAEAAYHLVKAKRDHEGTLLNYLKEHADKDPGGHYAKLRSEKVNEKLQKTIQKAVRVYQKAAAADATEEDKTKAHSAGERLLALTVEAGELTKDKGEKQNLYVFKALAYRMMEDQEGVDSAWKAAVAINSEAPILRRAETMIKPTPAPTDAP